MGNDFLDQAMYEQNYQFLGSRFNVDEAGTPSPDHCVELGCSCHRTPLPTSKEAEESGKESLCSNPSCAIY